MNRKYELLKEADFSFNYYGIQLHRIRALRDFGKVKAGELGGYLQREANLSHEGTCWVGPGAAVYRHARVSEDAQVFQGLPDFGTTRIEGSAQVSGRARVSEGAWVFDRALVYGDARVRGRAKVSGDAQVFDYADVFGRACVFGLAQVSGAAQVGADRYVDSPDTGAQP